MGGPVIANCGLLLGGFAQRQLLEPSGLAFAPVWRLGDDDRGGEVARRRIVVTVAGGHGSCDRQIEAGLQEGDDRVPVQVVRNVWPALADEPGRLAIEQ